METNADWAASALFSPSKARVQQAQAKDWAAVDAWLNRRYGSSRLPSYEKNEETLQTLLTLANLNDTADEQRNQLDRVEKNALSALTKRPVGVAHDLLQLLLAQLGDDDNLDTLAELIIALECRGTDALDVGRDISALLSEDFDARQRLLQANAQLKALKHERANLKTTLDELQTDKFEIPSEISENMNDWIKSAKHLRAKIAEYDERLAAARPKSSDNHIELVQQRTTESELLRAQLEKAREHLKAMQELPLDEQAARSKVGAARQQLRTLSTTRDRLFEGLLDA
jgi:HAUS augmin-like complex subunit 1